MDNRTALGQEWRTLQHDCERYEYAALGIKVVAVVLFFAGTAWAPVAEQAPWLLGLVLLVLWLQEGIVKTYQARLAQRLLEVEQLLLADAARDAPGGAFQLHSRWLASRKGLAGLLVEYLASACRPTVAFPYAVLLLALVVRAL